jgi:hypothetical protein
VVGHLGRRRLHRGPRNDGGTAEGRSRHGEVAVTGEPTYKADIKSVAFDGRKMTAKYDFPADDSAEVVLAAFFDGNKATGSWSLREKATGNEAATGTFSLVRK